MRIALSIVTMACLSPAVAEQPISLEWLPRVVMADDEVFVLWQEIVFSGGTHGGEAFFARSTDGGRTFSDPVNLSETTHGAGKGRLTEEYWHNGSLDVALGNDGSLQGLLMDKLALTPRGGIVVVNSTIDRDVSSHVWLMQTTH